MNYKVGDRVYIIPEKVENNNVYREYAGKVGTLIRNSYSGEMWEMKFDDGTQPEPMFEIRFCLHTKLHKALK